MEFDIYKAYRGKQGEIPDFSLNNKIYYNKMANVYWQYAATLFIKDGKYRIEGPDREIKDFLINEIGNHNYLMRDKEEKVGDCYATFMVPTPFGHPEFKKALYDTIPGKYRLDSPALYKMPVIANQEEADRLREEYLKTKEKDV